jgi:hypothetical protein
MAFAKHHPRSLVVLQTLRMDSMSIRSGSAQIRVSIMVRSPLFAAGLGLALVTPLHAVTITDQFAWEHREGFVSLCSGNPWVSDVERGRDAALHFGQYITNGVKLRCGRPDEFCEPGECYFIGVQIIDDNGRFYWYAAPKSAYPSNLVILEDHH